jgi:hypothetical protein
MNLLHLLAVVLLWCSYFFLLVGKACRNVEGSKVFRVFIPTSFFFSVILFAPLPSSILSQSEQWITWHVHSSGFSCENTAAVSLNTWKLHVSTERGCNDITLCQYKTLKLYVMRSALKIVWIWFWSTQVQHNFHFIWSSNLIYWSPQQNVSSYKMLAGLHTGQNLQTAIITCTAEAAFSSLWWILNKIHGRQFFTRAVHYPRSVHFQVLPDLRWPVLHETHTQ